MNFIELSVIDMRVSHNTYQKVVILVEMLQVEKGVSKSPRYLPIWITDEGANAIEVIRQKINIPRPQTHDFIKNILDAIGCRVKSVVITTLENDIFYARTIIEVNDKSYDVDCIPSDAIALALRLKAKIFVAEDIMEKASIAEDVYYKSAHNIPLEDKHNENKN